MSIVTSILQGAAGVVGVRSGTEEPRFEVLERIGEAVEIRRYGPRLAADVTVAADEMAARSVGFRRLARFIFGANRARDTIAMTAPVTVAPGAGGSEGQGGAGGSARIAMTAPVTVVPADTAAWSTAESASDARSGGDPPRWTIRFFMPEKFTRETLPVPNDAGIAIVEVPAETVAVIRFAGSTAPEAVQHQARLLTRILKTSAWRAVGAPVAQFYDPPWTLPPLRRNEVAQRVER
ncbi:SOUL family heme-binding protein [Rhodoplanes azumiensis]|uniref:SOUL family heme-binding protein n=1 Tax=Rhodoplanes azumiensis TaxID=1897628 RepID=A0ABW5AMQ5_9BRAD